MADLTTLPRPGPPVGPGGVEPAGLIVTAVVATAGLAVAAAVGLDWRLVVPIALGLPLAAAIVLGEWGAFGPPGEAPTEAATAARVRSLAGVSSLHGDRLVSAAWAGLLLTPALRLFEGQRYVGEASSGDASLDILIELAATGVAGLVVASALRAGWSVRVRPPAWLLLGFALFAAISTIWSDLPAISAARGFQFLVLAAFTVYTADRAASEEGYADRIIVRTFRIVAFAVVALVLWGFSEGGEWRGRFTWRGSHPNNSASMMLVVVLALIFHPRRREITRPLPWWLVAGLLAYFAYETGSRGYAAAAVAAVVTGWVITAVRDTQRWALGLGVVLIVAAVAWGVAAEEILDFVYRGQSTETIVSLHGRRELWVWALANPVGSEIWGIGIGANRGVINAPWNPQNAHNAWIDLLQMLGVLGMALMGAFIASLLSLATFRGSVQAAWMTVFVLVASLNSITIANPGPMTVILGLAVVALHDRDPVGALHDRDPVGEPRPAPG